MDQDGKVVNKDAEKVCLSCLQEAAEKLLHQVMTECVPVPW